jgi:hypothetical protein
MATRDEIIEILNMLKRLPGSPITGATVDDVKRSINDVLPLFLAVLEDLPVEMVRTATVQYCSEGNPFFPMPGVIRDKAMELQLLALGIPTPAEAWGMVLNARQYIPGTFCEAGAALRRDVEGNPPDYWQALNDYGDHMNACTVCDKGGFQDVYGHAAVEETVKLLGGRDVVLTENEVADRARFIEAYREIVKRERTKYSMIPRVRQFIEERATAVLNSPADRVKELASGMKIS